MATLIENALSMESAKANIKSAIEEKGQDLTNVPFTEYASKIKEIESGGGSSDLIDVKELPTTDIQDDKVYRTTNSTGTYCVSLVVTSQDQTAIISFESMLKMMNITLPPMNEIIVENINDVTEPILSGESFVVYTDKSTGIGYVFGDLEGTGNVERLTLAEFFNMFNSLTGELYPTLSDKGAIDDASEITEDGIYYLQNVSIKTIIGVPNTNNNKQVYEYNGVEWNEYSSLTTDNLVGLWRDVRLSGSADLYFQEFKADGTIVYKNQYGDTFGLPTEYTIRDGLVFTIDLDGVSTNYKYIVRDGLPTLNNADTDELILEKVTELNINNLVDVDTLPLFANDDKVYRVTNETETQIGVPNANNDKKILQYNGTEWTEVSAGGGEDMLQARIDSNNSCEYLFYGYKGKNLDFADKIDTSKATSMRSMYDGCSSLTKINTKILKTSNVTSMHQMFNGCQYIETLDVSNLDVSKVTETNMMFQSCNKLKTLNLENFKPNGKVSATSMFSGDYGLQSISFGEFGVNGFTSIQQMFNGCSGLKTLDLSSFNTEGLTGIYGVFMSCSKLEDVIFGDKFDTTSVTNMSYLFYGCSVIATIPTLDLIKTTSTSNMFNNCKNLTHLTLKNIKANIQIGQGTTWGYLLTNESLLNTAQELWDNTNNALGGTRTLTMATASKTAIQSVYVKLVDVTDEMRAEDEYIANKKPCVECDSTDDGAMTLEEYILSKNWSIA